MIEDNIKDKIFAITSYCDTTEKVNVLVQNINLIRTRFPGFKIALHANYPLSEDIQKIVDRYFYEDLNFTPQDKWIYYWGIMINKQTSQSYFNKKFFYSIKDTGFAVFQQIRALTKYLIEYNWVMLINYDTSVEEIRIEDYSTDYDLTVHFFPEQKAYSLIIMFFNPQIFFDKVAKYFTYDNWMKIDRVNQLNEERFYDMVNESDIKHFGHNYKISDKVGNEPDFFKPNAPINEFFENYLLYAVDGTLEIYLWNLLIDIRHIMVKINDEIFVSCENLNKMGGFEYRIDIRSMNFNPEQLNEVRIKKINNINTNIVLKIKKGYVSRPI